MNGDRKCGEAGRPIPGNLGKALMDFRDENPELYQKMYDLGMYIYIYKEGVCLVLGFT